MIQFVANYEDLSNDKGYQFKFFCDKCRNGYMSKWTPSKAGLAGTVLRTAGQIFGGILGSASHSTYELQRMVGGPEHDAALRDAMEEGKKYFHQCTRCGKWVCPQACWNEKNRLCEDCAPNFDEQVASHSAQAKSDVAREQLYERARSVDYTSGISMAADAAVRAPDVPDRPPSTPVCRKCNADVGNAKFCPQCGTPTAAPRPQFCPECGAKSEPGAKFCPECGKKLG